MTVDSSCKKTLRVLTRLSSRLPRRKRQEWTPRSDFYLRSRMKLLKMVCSVSAANLHQNKSTKQTITGGIPIDTLPGSDTAVYSGSMTNDYELLSTRDIYDMPHNSATGNGRTMLANRLSWFFDLQGPSIMMDTACSSSLTAVHLAAQALRSGECGMVRPAFYAYSLRTNCAKSMIPGTCDWS